MAITLKNGKEVAAIIGSPTTKLIVVNDYEGRISLSNGSSNVN